METPQITAYLKTYCGWSAGVRAALVAYDQVGALGEHVDHLPLALVAPLGADDHDAMRFRSEHGPLTQQKTPRQAGRSSIL